MKADAGGSLIYIIISIVLLIISSIGKSKKKPVNPPTTDFEPDYTNPQPSQEQNPKKQNEWPKELEDIFGKIFDPEPPKPEVIEVPTYEEEVITEKYTSPFENYQFNNESLEVIENENQSLEVISSIDSDLRVTNDITEIKTNENEEGIYITDDFGIEKAIIYSEIINRKYF